jgi:SAM-dependent methyltransferase
VGRLPYPEALPATVRAELELDGAGRLLDVGCGPGSLTLPLAPLFAEVVGIDADAGMIDEAAKRARDAGVGNVRWVRMRGEELSADLGEFRVATFAQSFHWMDGDRVAAIVRDMLEPGGRLVHVGATTHRGVATDQPLPAPSPPREEISELVVRYLGGLGRPPARVARGEDDVYRRAGFEGPRRVTVPRDEIFLRSEDEIVASVFSLSSAAPHLFGERRDAFERDLRALLRTVSPDGRFAEKAREIEFSIWQPPGD